MAKQKTCKLRTCKKKFTPVQFAQCVCDWKCSIEYEKQKKADKEKKEHTKAKQVFKMNDKPLQKNLAQKAFNRFIRLRDKDLPCISCGTINDIQYCAGHFLTRGSRPDLSFNEDNVHKQCNKRCNLELSGNVVPYRVNLIERIGIERVEALEATSEPKKYTAEDYVAIKKKYLKLGNELEAK